MSEFTPIETQEAFDAAIKDRLNRQTEKHNAEIENLKARFADYETLKTSNAELLAKAEGMSKKAAEEAEKCAGYDSKVAEYEAKIKQYELKDLKAKIAGEVGLTNEAIDFLQGETEEDIRASAEKLQKIVPRPVAPLANSDRPEPNAERAAMKELTKNLFK